jgi:hypothetical protein
MATPQATPPSRGSAPLIRHASEPVAGDRTWRLLPPVLASVVFHAVLIPLLLFLAPGPAPALSTERVPAEGANVQAESPPEPASDDPFNTTDVDPAGLDREMDINNPSPRIADVSVDGIVNPDFPVGVEGGSQTTPPISLPAALGASNLSGPGAALESPTGTMHITGQAGGTLRGQPLALTFYGRGSGTREQLLVAGGGTKESEARVKQGLNWLVRVQSPDGRWRLDGNFRSRGRANDIAGTAFGLLPFLGAGKTHKAAKDNPYDKPIERALLFLIRKQDRRTGNFGGGMYGHCLAAIAMSEAYGLTQDPFLRRPTQLAVNYIVLAQHGEGGWRYSPGEKGDTSVTGWAVMALKSARMAGLDVPEVTFRKGMRYLDGCCDPTNEGYGYTGVGSTPTMSAVGLLCRQYLQDWGSQNARMIKGVKNNLLTSPPPTAGTAPGSMYYYYYATQVLHHFGTDAWKRWNDRMRDCLIKSQDTSNDPNLRGSWDPAGDPYAATGGRLMRTSLCLLTLEVYYRHLPLYYREAGERREKVLQGP